MITESVRGGCRVWTAHPVGRVPEMDPFDPLFLRSMPSRGKKMDPYMRLLLEVA